MRHLHLSHHMLNHHLRRFTTTAHHHFHQTLTHHLKNNNLTAALTLFYNNPNTPKTHQTYADIFHACARLNSISHGFNLHHHMIKTHQQNQIKPTLYISNHLVNMYAKCGFLENARKVFDEMPERNIVTWSVLVSGYCQFGCFEEGFRLFCEMVKVLRPNEFAYVSVLSCCGLEDGRQVHAHAMKTCFDGFTYVGNALVKMYASGGSVREAWRVFQCLEFRNIVTWNSMVAAFQSGGKWEDGLRLFTLMRRERGVGFDRATLLSVLSSLLMVKDNGSDVISLCLKYCSQVHCLAIKTWFITEIGVVTALAKAYADLGAEMSDLYRLFMETSGMRDIVSWTAFITIFAEHDPEESLLMFSKLFQEGFSPDRHTYSIVLKACAGLVTGQHTLSIHSQILKYGFENDTVLANALIHAYGRSGLVLESIKVFDSMFIKDIVSWNSMIKIYGLHGQLQEALKCFDEMNIHPDSTTFVALLSACSHTGLVKEGTKLFESMSKTYGIAPQLDHYACMVDIFGRSGQTLEAQKLINEMPIEPDSVIWSAMLGACRKHGDTKLAEFAAKKLQELDPNNSLGYVQMSNIMCSNGTFNEAVDIRKQMRGLGVKKGPGLSWTEVGKRVHEFGSGGVHHPQIKIICGELEELVKELKGLGYVAETNLAMRDMEEEDKNRELSYHSEKLAFVFALKHAESKASRRAIRIVKNIRICVDCHNFMKFASDLTGREIIVRDSNRFHHFRNRLCSCDDYW